MPMGMDLAPLPGGSSAYVHSSSELASTNTNLDFYAGAVDWRLPWPRSQFPFNRLASALVSNSTEVYLYHQLDDSVFAEDYWDGTSQFWRSSNITINLA